MSNAHGADNKITLTVVVSGTPTELETSIHATFQSLAERALAQTGNNGNDLSKWDLTTEASTQLKFGAKVGDAGLQDGDTVFLSLRAGVTG